MQKEPLLDQVAEPVKVVHVRYLGLPALEPLGKLGLVEEEVINILLLDLPCSLIDL